MNDENSKEMSSVATAVTDVPQLESQLASQAGLMDVPDGGLWAWLAVVGG